MDSLTCSGNQILLGTDRSLRPLSVSGRTHNGRRSLSDQRRVHSPEQTDYGVPWNQCDVEWEEFVLENSQFSKEGVEISDFYLKLHEEFSHHRGTLIILSVAHFLNLNLIFLEY